MDESKFKDVAIEKMKAMLEKQRKELVVPNGA